MHKSLMYPPFYIQNVRIDGRILLAPMDGYTDSPFRALCRKFGSAMSTSEFINGIDLTHGHPHLKYKTHFVDQERPFVYQVFDNDPERLLQSSLILESLHPDLIDINMGCSARNVSNRGAGAGLLRDPLKVKEIITLLTSRIHIPITAKIRLGWDDSTKNYLEISKILEDCGASAITIHARTRRQEYSGSADWNAIAELKANVSIPVIGNGDIDSLDTASRMIEMTGCDAVMIGRAAIGNPWVFCGRDKSKIDYKEFLITLQEHLVAMENLYGKNIGVTLFRKHLARYLPVSDLTVEQKVKVFTCSDHNELMTLVSQYSKNMDDSKGDENVFLE